MVCTPKRTFRDRYGEWALVTGGSSGIGKAIATELARRSMNVVIVARGQKNLDQAAEEIKAASPGVQVRTISADLGSLDSIEQIIQAVADIEIGLLVPGAAMEDHGYFVLSDERKQSLLLEMDCHIPMRLAHHFGKLMTQRKKGAILFISSLSGWSGQPYMANYGAAKAYILSLGEGMHHEMKNSGIDVTVLSPGPTKTPMIKDLPINFKKMGMAVMLPEDVAKCGLNALGKRAHAIPGARNRIMLNMMTKMMTRNAVGTIFRKMLGGQLKVAKYPYQV